MLSNQKIVLTGLPGSGKTRVMNVLKQQFSCDELTVNDLNETANLTRPGCFEWQDFTRLPLTLGVNHCSENQQIWCVIDVRSKLPDVEWLQQALENLLMVADGVVFNFVEAASIDEQSWWSRWLKEHSDRVLPIVRCLNAQLPGSFTGFEIVKKDDKLFNVKLHDIGQLQHFEFEVSKVVLDHLLMGLDNSRQNLSMKICRVKALLNTLEYENIVALEGSAYRWDSYAADWDGSELKLGRILVSGIGLDQAWLKQLVDACKC